MQSQEENKINKLTRADYDKINEALIRKNPHLGLIDERVVYDKEFLLEVQGKGYNPLDKEDVKNYLEGKAPKNLERNLKLCGADQYKSLGQSEFEEVDLKDYMSKTGKKPILKKSEDVYLSDIPAKKAKEYLIESNDEYGTMEINRSSEQNEEKEHSKSEDQFRKNLAKAFGSDDMKIRQSDYISDSKELIRSDEKTSKMLELIKELRAVGFTPEEIKKEIQRFH